MPNHTPPQLFLIDGYALIYRAFYAMISRPLRTSKGENTSAAWGVAMTLIADGTATLEHNIPLSTFYEDVLSYFSQSKTNYTPTLVVTFGGPAGDPYWRAATDVFEQPILKRHIPPAQLLAAAVGIPAAFM